MAGLQSELVDNYSCRHLCLYFLDILSSDLKIETSNLVHDLCRKDVADESAKERCTNVILKIERELGPDHYLCELVIKIFSGSLRKICMLEHALELVNEHMNRKNSEDIGCLLLCAHIYALLDDFHKGVEPLKKALQLAEKSAKPLYVCLVLAKEACNIWHLKDPEKAKEKVALCERTLEDVGVEEINVAFPLDECTQRLIDLYKTLGYLYNVFGNPEKRVQYLLKALEIFKKEKKAVTEMIKLESMILDCLSTVDKRKTLVRGLDIFEIIKNMAKEEPYMIHHSLQIIQYFQQVAFTMEFSGFQIEALEMREYLSDIAEKYIDKNHPEVARLAASAAYLCNKMKNTQKESVYVERAQAVLECNSMDLNHIKLHVKEISDAWFILGVIFRNNKDFEQSERCFKEAVFVNTRVYGLSHPRLIRLYREMGYLYNKTSNFFAALECFERCKELKEEFNKDDVKTIQKLTSLIEGVKALQMKQ